MDSFLLTSLPNFLKILVANDQKLKGTSFEDFLQEADANKDGKVSIEECATWMDQYVNK